MPYTPPTNTSTPTSSPVPSEGTAGKGSSVDLKKERDEIRARLVRTVFTYSQAFCFFCCRLAMRLMG